MMAVIAATAFPPVRGTLFCVIRFAQKLVGVGLLPTDGHIEKRHCDFCIAVPFAITDF